MTESEFPGLEDVAALLNDPVGARLTAYGDDDTTVVYTAPLAPQYRIYRIDPDEEPLLYVRPLIDVPQPGQPFDLASNRSRTLNLPPLAIEQDEHGHTVVVFDQGGQRVTLTRGDEDTSWAMDLWGSFLETCTPEQLEFIRALPHSYLGEVDPDDVWREMGLPLRSKGITPIP